MKVRVEVLRQALDVLLDHAEAIHEESIELDADLYWFVPKEAVGDPTAEPTELTLGSLQDDFAELAAIASGGKEPLGYGLVWAAAVLRAVGDRT